jgi:hypothetical protein
VNGHRIPGLERADADRLAEVRLDLLNIGFESDLQAQSLNLLLQLYHRLVTKMTLRHGCGLSFTQSVNHVRTNISEQAHCFVVRHVSRDNKDRATLGAQASSLQSVGPEGPHFQHLVANALPAMRSNGLTSSKPNQTGLDSQITLLLGPKTQWKRHQFIDVRDRGRLFSCVDGQQVGATGLANLHLELRETR